MNSRPMNSIAFAAIAAVTLLGGTRSAQALEMTVDTLQPAQVPYTSSVKLGHMVNARTYMISLAIGGTFRVSCPSPYTGTIDGGNSATQTDLPPNVLSVEVPAGWLPAYRTLPGFESLPGGTSLTCTYYWTATGKEAMYSLGVPGFGIPIGGESINRSDSVTFEMYKPGAGDSDDNNGCIH